MGLGGLGQVEVRFSRVLPLRDEQTNKQGKIGLLSQWTMEGWDEQFHYHDDRKSRGGLRELPATWVLFPRGEEGGQKIAAISPNQVQKIARCYSFSNHAVSSPPDDGCEDARRPTGHLRDDPMILVLMMGSLRTSQAAGGFTITPHTPGVQCCTKRARQRNLIAF